MDGSNEETGTLSAPASVHEAARAARRAVYEAFLEGRMRANQATVELLAANLLEQRAQRPAEVHRPLR